MHEHPENFVVAGRRPVRALEREDVPSRRIFRQWVDGLSPRGTELVDRWWGATRCATGRRASLGESPWYVEASS